MWSNRTPRASKELTAKEIAALLEAAQVSEQEIRQLHEDFLDRYPSGRLDKKTFIEYYQRLNPNIEAQSSFEKTFEMMDVDNDGTVDFNELLVVMVLTNRLNDLGSRLAFVFDMWDVSGDGQIDQEELVNVISAIYNSTGITDRKGDKDPKKRAKEIINKLDINRNKKLSKEEFITGCKNDPVICNLLALGE